MYNKSMSVINSLFAISAIVAASAYADGSAVDVGLGSVPSTGRSISWKFYGNGIAGYDLLSTNDKIIPVRLDKYNASYSPAGNTKADLIMYRPGLGALHIKAFDGAGNWVTKWAGYGINGMDLKGLSDQIIPIDYNGDGATDLIVYRPGSGVVSVMQGNGGGNFTLAYNASNGFFGYDLRDVRDQFVVADFNKDQLEDVIIYRPGGRSVMVFLANQEKNGRFTSVTAPSAIFSYDFMSNSDQIKTLDFNGDNCSDLFIYRPGTGINYLLKSNCNGTFSQIQTGSGFNGYDLKHSGDQVVTGNFSGDYSGRSDLCLYRPAPSGSFLGAFWRFRSQGDGSFTPTWKSNTISAPINNYSKSFSPRTTLARCAPANLDGYSGTDLFCWQSLSHQADPGQGSFELGNSNGTFTRAWSSSSWLYYSGVGEFDFRQATQQVTVLKNARGAGKDALLFWAPGNGVAQYTYLN